MGQNDTINQTNKILEQNRSGKFMHFKVVIGRLFFFSQFLGYLTSLLLIQFKNRINKSFYNCSSRGFSSISLVVRNCRNSNFEKMRKFNLRDVENFSLFLYSCVRILRKSNFASNLHFYFFHKISKLRQVFKYISSFEEEQTR
jgi:hypothetical protein